MAVLNVCSLFVSSIYIGGCGSVCAPISCENENVETDNSQHTHTTHEREQCEQREMYKEIVKKNTTPNKYTTANSKPRRKTQNKPYKRHMYYGVRQCNRFLFTWLAMYLCPCSGATVRQTDIGNNTSE